MKWYVKDMYDRAAKASAEPKVVEPKIKEEKVEEVDVEVEEKSELTIDMVEDIVKQYGYSLKQNVEYIAIKNGRRNVATINNNITYIKLKNRDDAIKIYNVEDLKKALKEV